MQHPDHEINWTLNPFPVPPGPRPRVVFLDDTEEFCRRRVRLVGAVAYGAAAAGGLTLYWIAYNSLGAALAAFMAVCAVGLLMQRMWSVIRHHARRDPDRPATFYLSTYLWAHFTANRVADLDTGPVAVLKMVAGMIALAVLVGPTAWIVVPLIGNRDNLYGCEVLYVSGPDSTIFIRRRVP